MTDDALPASVNSPLTVGQFAGLGRAVHIHVRARIDGDTVLTGQIYFDEAYTEAVFATGAYAEFGSPDTTWARDGIAGDPATDGSGVTVAAGPTSLDEGTLGLINLGVAV